MMVGGLLVVVGSMLPWALTPIAPLSGLVGPGLWTIGAGFIALAGAVLPYRRIAIAHAGLGATVSLALVTWQLGHLVYLSAITAAWGQLLPGMGMVMVTGGAVILVRSCLRMYRAV